MAEAELAGVKVLLDTIVKDVADIKRKLDRGGDMFVRREVFEARLKPIQWFCCIMASLIFVGFAGAVSTALF